ncbi:MAG: UDP-N-acetylmuramoyl-tripeptide--D-alanyl-D-alanine ligase [Burkholderiaceae bacterium]
MMTLAQAHALLPASTLVGDGATEVLRVHSDTRSLQPGDLFVALRGEHFDAHDYLALAKVGGAAAALAERGLLEADIAGLEVADSQLALTELARAWRRRFQLPLIAVTGSNGKTTVTQMIASILRAWLAESAFATAGNFNNHIGVPLTLLRLRQDDNTWHRAGVVELGMNHPGEIARLAALTAPTVALVNNAQREHQEFMASVEAVALENGAVIQALGPTGVAVFPADDAHTALWHALAANRPTLTFALQGRADLTCSAAWDVDHWALVFETPAGAVTLQLRAPGWHNVKNALAAAACALAVGCPLAQIARGLEAFEPVKGRSQARAITHRGRAVTLIDDSYNANPDSVRAAIDVLAALTGPRWLVLGDMGEVGDQGPVFHAEVGAYAQARGIDALWAAGAMSVHAAKAFAGARHFDAVASLVAALAQAPVFNTVLVKGSRFMRMEQVVSALMNAEGAHAA